MDGSPSKSFTPTDLALASLSPKGYSIPTFLLEHARHLHSLSLRRAKSLQQTEEIARSHVCAEIAWKQLRVQLRLPNIKSGHGAPVPPKIYTRLLSYLESALAQEGSQPGTPRKYGEISTPGRSGTGSKRRIDALSVDSPVGSSTPSKKQKLSGSPLKDAQSPTKTPVKPSSFLARVQAASVKKPATVSEAPEIVLPNLRRICTAFKTPKLIPHVFTGVLVILRLSRRWPPSLNPDNPYIPAVIEDKETGLTFDQNTRCLILALYLLTLTRMQSRMTTDLYNAILLEGRWLVDLDKKTDGLEKSIFDKTIGDWIGRMTAEKWQETSGPGLDWWSSIPQEKHTILKIGTVTKARQNLREAEAELKRKRQQDMDQDKTRALVESENSEDGEDVVTPRAEIHQRRVPDKNVQKAVEKRKAWLRKQLEESDDEDVLLPGLGTAMNETTDILSKENMTEYEIWKAEALRKIDRIQRKNGWT